MQKAMLVNTFEAMKLEDEMEKIVDSVVETGEVTLFVGWETKTRKQDVQFLCASSLNVILIKIL